MHRIQGRTAERIGPDLKNLGMKMIAVFEPEPGSGLGKPDQVKLRGMTGRLRQLPPLIAVLVIAPGVPPPAEDRQNIIPGLRDIEIPLGGSAEDADLQDPAAGVGGTMRAHAVVNIRVIPDWITGRSGPVAKTEVDSIFQAADDIRNAGGRPDV